MKNCRVSPFSLLFSFLNEEKARKEDGIPFFHTPFLFRNGKRIVFFFSLFSFFLALSFLKREKEKERKGKFLIFFLFSFLVEEREREEKRKIGFVF